MLKSSGAIPPHSERMRGILLLDDLKARLVPKKANKTSGSDDVWKTNLKYILGAMNLVQYHRWDNVSYSTSSVPTESWSDSKILETLIGNFNIRTLNLYHYCVERKISMNEQELTEILASERPKGPNKRTVPEDKLKNTEDVLNFLFCLRKEMRQLSRDIEDRIPTIPDDENPTTEKKSRWTLRNELCKFWDPCVTETSSEGPTRWQLSPQLIQKYMQKWQKKPTKQQTPKPQQREPEELLKITEKTSGQTFVLQSTFRTLQYVRVFMFVPVSSSQPPKPTRQLIIAIRPFDLPDDYSTLPIEHSKRLVSTLCSDKSPSVSPVAADGINNIRFHDSVRIPLAMKPFNDSFDTESNQKPSTLWIHQQQYLFELNRKIKIHSGFWETALNIAKDVQFRMSLEGALLVCVRRRIHCLI